MFYWGFSHAVFSCYSHIKGRMFAALANGSAAVFCRSAGMW